MMEILSVGSGLRTARARVATAPVSTSRADSFTPSTLIGGDALRLKMGTWGASLVSAAFLAAPVSALANDNVPEAPSAAPTVTAPPTPPDDVPWYDPLEQRAHDINDGFKGFKDNVGAYATKLERKLNDNALGNYHAAGTLGDYHWTFDGMHVHVDPYITLQANRVGAGVRADAELGRAVLQKTVTEGDWSRTQGVRADLYTRLEVGQGASLSVKGLQSEAPHGHFFGPRMEMFVHWKRDGEHDWKISADVNAGTSIDFSNNAPVTYVRGLQRFENDQLTRRWLGEGSRLRVELEEGVQYSPGNASVDGSPVVGRASGHAEPYYRAFGGVGKPVPFSFRGKKHTVDVEVGLRATGSRQEPFTMAPQVRARLHW